ncbi:endonuclease domain-containing protein [Williamsia sp. M5A3_1d]
MAAAWWHGVGERAPGTVAVIAPRGRNGRRLSGVLVTHRDLDERDIVVRSELAVAALPLAVLEAASNEGALAVLDQALLRGRVSMKQLHDAHARYPGRRGAASTRRILAAAASGARSEAERILVALLRRSDIRGWRANRERGGHLVDLVFDAARVVVEVDGMAFHTDAETFQRDRRRQNELINAGWAVLRFTWTDVTTRPGYVVATIRRALERGRSDVSR